MNRLLADESVTLTGATLAGAIAWEYARKLEATLAAGLWPPGQLDELQNTLEGLDPLPGLARAIRQGERAQLLQRLRARVAESKRYFFGFAPPFRALIPNGWIDQNAAHYARAWQLGLDGVDMAGRRLNARAVEAGYRQFSAERRKGPFLPFSLFSAISIPHFRNVLHSAAESQTLVDQAYLACALERYRATHGGYPVTIEALVPKFTAQVPHDLFDGRPLRYRRTDDGRYLLYSIGWDSKDDEGRMGGREPTVDRRRPEWQDDDGDWVWPGVP